MNHVVIGLGSNIEPDQNIQQALEVLKQKYHVIAASCFKATKPIGIVEQTDFINGSVLIETELTIKQLKTGLGEIEKTMGRNRLHNRCKPRTIDLDIVVWNENIVDQDFYDRNYLRESVLELIPALKY